MAEQSTVHPDGWIGDPAELQRARRYRAALRWGTGPFYLLLIASVVVAVSGGSDVPRRRDLRPAADPRLHLTPLETATILCSRSDLSDRPEAFQARLRSGTGSAAFCSIKST